MITYDDIYKQFKKETGVKNNLIEDYRPCKTMYDVPNIPNAIVVWLTNGSKLIYIYEPEPKTVVLCGSSKFKKEHQEAAKRFALEGNIVLGLDVFSHYDDENTTEERLDILKKIHYKKIDMADVVFVVNPGKYIGEQTKKEIAYAEMKGKEILYLEPDTDRYHNQPIGNINNLNPAMAKIGVSAGSSIANCGETLAKELNKYFTKAFTIDPGGSNNEKEV